MSGSGLGEGHLITGISGPAGPLNATGLGSASVDKGTTRSNHEGNDNFLHLLTSSPRTQFDAKQPVLIVIAQRLRKQLRDLSVCLLLAQARTASPTRPT
jgi:hypothetical protein